MALRREPQDIQEVDGRCRPPLAIHRYQRQQLGAMNHLCKARVGNRRTRSRPEALQAAGSISVQCTCYKKQGCCPEALPLKQLAPFPCLVQMQQADKQLMSLSASRTSEALSCCPAAACSCPAQMPQAKKLMSKSNYPTAAGLAQMHQADKQLMS